MPSGAGSYCSPLHGADAATEVLRKVVAFEAVALPDIGDGLFKHVAQGFQQIGLVVNGPGAGLPRDLHQNHVAFGLRRPTGHAQGGAPVVDRPGFDEAVEGLGGFLHADKLVLLQVQGVALAQGQDELELTGADDIGDLVGEGQGLQGGAIDHGGQRQGQARIDERAYAVHHLVVVSAHACGGRARPFQADIDEGDFAHHGFGVLQAAGGVGGNAENVQAGIHVDDFAEVAANEGLTAGEEYSLNTGQVVADAFEFGEAWVGVLKRLGAERAVEVAAFGDLQNH